MDCVAGCVVAAAADGAELGMGVLVVWRAASSPPFARYFRSVGCQTYHVPSSSSNASSSGVEGAAVSLSSCAAAVVGSVVWGGWEVDAGAVLGWAELPSTPSNASISALNAARSASVVPVDFPFLQEQGWKAVTR